MHWISVPGLRMGDSLSYREVHGELCPLSPASSRGEIEVGHSATQVPKPLSVSPSDTTESTEYSWG